MSAVKTTTTSAPMFVHSILLVLLALICMVPGAEANNLGLNVSGGVVGFLVLALDLVAIFEVLNSQRETLGKVGWALLIFCFPVLGLIVYFLFGRKQNEYTAIAA
ncbi:hypothetical protein HKX48_009257 [Thoreauomyces humboldtii]|nr:hypothetical protein HKX48_009257 [Thoreauomyces humboldtii]